MRVFLAVLMLVPSFAMAQQSDCELRGRDLDRRMDLNDPRSLSLQRDLDRGRLMCRDNPAQGSLMLDDVRRRLDRQEAQIPPARPGWEPPGPSRPWVGAGPGADFD